MIQNKPCHFSICMGPRKAVVFWVHSHHSLMTSLHSSRIVWTYWAQRTATEQGGIRKLTRADHSCRLVSLQFFPSGAFRLCPFSPLCFRINRASPILSFPWYTARLWLRWNLQQSAHTHQPVAGEHLLSMIDLVPFLSEPEFRYLMDSTPSYFSPSNKIIFKNKTLNLELRIT